MILKKIIKGIGIVPLVILGGLLIIYFFFLPPVLKYVIENQGEKRLGRKVEVGHAYLQESMNNYPFDSFRINHISG